MECRTIFCSEYQLSVEGDKKKSIKIFLAYSIEPPVNQFPFLIPFENTFSILFCCHNKSGFEFE